MVNSLSVTNDTLNLVSAKTLLSENNVSIVGLSNAQILEKATELLNTPTTTKNPLAVKAFEKMPLSGNPESLNSNAILAKFGVSTSEEFEALLEGQTVTGKIKSFETLPFAKLNLQAGDIEKAKANGLKDGVRYKLACTFQDSEKAIDFVLSFDRCLQSGTMLKLMEITGFVVGEQGFEFQISRPNGSQWLQMTNIA